MMTLAVRSRCRPRIGRSLALRRPWSASTLLSAYWVVSCMTAGTTSPDRLGQRRRLVRGHLDGLAVSGDRGREELGGCGGVALLGDIDVDDLPVLVDGAVDVSPSSGDLRVGLVDEPTVADCVTARPS